MCVGITCSDVDDVDCDRPADNRATLTPRRRTAPAARRRTAPAVRALSDHADAQLWPSSNSCFDYSNHPHGSHDDADDEQALQEALWGPPTSPPPGNGLTFIWAGNQVARRSAELDAPACGHD